MKKLFCVLALAALVFGCTSVPTDSSTFGPEEIGAVHYAAEGLAFEEATYLFVGKGADFLVQLCDIDTENYTEAFGVRQSMMALGIFNKYIQLVPGEHDLGLYAMEQGRLETKGNTVIMHELYTDMTFDFAAGFVYVFDQLESGNINIKYWKIGSTEIFEDEFLVTAKND
ncbi:MAG: hypothetical protein PQJ59_08000 [Spirochaetales bacterium]|nr:hypothetical protein [Spirochaetales bacterium]